MSVDPLEIEKMNIVIVGHVDHGKSTLIGRLLADTGALPEGKLEQIRAYCERNARPFEYAFLIDALKDERRQNITIDIARVFFQSSKRRYILLDAPGHVEFVKNMVSGAARAEAALLVIDAQEGVQENSRRHGHLLSMLGIRQMAVLVNKMDRVGYDRERFEAIRLEYSAFLQRVGMNAEHFLPLSAREGDNISQPSPNLPWYAGPTVLQVLDGFEKLPTRAESPFRMPVQDIYRFTALGDQRRILAGSISSGSARVNDEIVFYPSGKHSAIQSFETFQEAPALARGAGQPAGITLTEQIYVQRGELIARAGQTAPQVAKRLRVNLFWLGKDPLVTGKAYSIKLGTARSVCHVEQIRWVMDASTLESNSGATQVGCNQIAECILSLEHALAFDLAEALLETSRFVIVDGYEISGGGNIQEGLSDEEEATRDQVLRRNARWIPGNVSQEQRAERFGQHAGLVIITGPQGVGRKRLARLLEQDLFERGKLVYYLGMGSVIYGVNADIDGHSNSPNRREHIRRLAEVANILLDTGLVLIITAVELSQADLQLFETITGNGQIKTVWVGSNHTTDIRCNLSVEDCQDLKKTVGRIEAMLDEQKLFEA